MVKRMDRKTKAALVRERSALAEAIRRHPIQVTYGRRADMTLREYIAAIKRRDEIERLLAPDSHQRARKTARKT